MTKSWDTLIHVLSALFAFVVSIEAFMNIPSIVLWMNEQYKHVIGNEMDKFILSALLGYGWLLSLIVVFPAAFYISYELTKYIVEK